MWHQQVADASRGVVNYGYAAGIGYDQIPASVFLEGFDEAFDDRGNELAYDDRFPVNCPRYSTMKGPYAATHGTMQEGYYFMPPEQVALHLAPIFPNNPRVQLGEIAGMIPQLASLPQGHNLPNGAPVLHTGIRQRDPGQPTGTLYDNPRYPPREGKFAFFA